MAAKKNDMMTYLLLAAGAWAVWKYVIEPQQQQALLPAPGDTGTGIDQGQIPGGSPAPYTDSVNLEQAVTSHASADTLPMNLWRWGWHYNKVTGNPAPDVHLNQAFPGKSVTDIEAQVLSFQEWQTLARQYAVNPETGAVGGWNPSTGLFQASGMGAASTDSRTQGFGWGQGASASYSQWAGGTARRYQSSDQERKRVRPQADPDRPLARYQREREQRGGGKVVSIQRRGFR